MKILLVVESCFGRTMDVATAIADGIRSRSGDVDLVPAADAPTAVSGYDLVVVGAPTHNLGLPTDKSRAMAVQGGAQAVARGVREWLASASAGGVSAAAFDTRVPGPFSGSAAKAITKAGRRSGLRFGPVKGFAVRGTPPVLADGALEEARAWGESLAG